MTTDEDLLFADDDNELLFNEETSKDSILSKGLEDSWKVIIADDEHEIHTVTRFALSDYEYKGKKLKFLNAYSGIETIELLKKHSDVAIVLLDVVMESNDAGLRVVEKIRNELKNEFIRIIMRTGQPGQAPEDEVIIKYDINDYKNKTELTDKKLFTTITTGLRSYADIMEIESFRKNLEQKVIERTQQIAEQRDEIEKKNHEITSSINYAKRIQEAMLPDIGRIKRAIPELCIVFKPRDIVSGDFYWFSEKDGKVLIAAIDCTGHGVPGAFMSMVGEAHLNQIVNADAITSPDVILNKLHLRVRQSLKQEQTQNRDGMDVALCVIDKYRKVIEFAGARGSMVYIQEGTLKEMKGDRHPIGGEQKEAERIFSKQMIPLDSPLSVYLFSDGYPDQFGGEHDKKFMIRRLRELFFQIHPLTFEEQEKILDKTITDWKGKNKQTDDILVVGFKAG